MSILSLCATPSPPPGIVLPTQRVRCALFKKHVLQPPCRGQHPDTALRARVKYLQECPRELEDSVTKPGITASSFPNRTFDWPSMFFRLFFTSGKRGTIGLSSMGTKGYIFWEPQLPAEKNRIMIKELPLNQEIT